ncbi:MAG: hypothetical protein OXI91_15300 [Chloroflexota bacterium]|nr:hypothetical protein [Chloroflexota bacterium]
MSRPRRRRRAEGEARRVWAASLSPPPEDPAAAAEPCQHTWGEPEAVSLSHGTRDPVRVCPACQGFIPVCRGCGGYHLVHLGEDGEYSMAPWVSTAWLREHGCSGREFGQVPIPLVRTASRQEPATFVLATYGEIDGEPGSYELQWFS